MSNVSADHQGLKSLLGSKMARSDLEELLESKANKASVAAALQRKVNRADLEGFLASKVDLVDVEKICNILERKVDSSIFEEQFGRCVKHADLLS